MVTGLRFNSMVLLVLLLRFSSIATCNETITGTVDTIPKVIFYLIGLSSGKQVTLELENVSRNKTLRDFFKYTVTAAGQRKGLEPTSVLIGNRTIPRAGCDIKLGDLNLPEDEAEITYCY